MVWYTLYSRTPGTEGQNWNGNTLRQAVPITAYNIGAPPNGTQVRVTFHAGPGSNCNINESWFAHAGTNNISFDGTQVQLKVSAANFFTAPAGGLLVSDPVNYAFDKSKPIVISTDMVNHPTNVGRGTDPDIGFYFQTSGTVSTSTITGTEETQPTTGAHFQIWPKVEVFFTDPAGAATCTLTKNPGQVDPTSGTQVKFLAQFNKGVTGFSAADVDLSSSTVTWQGGSPNISIVGEDFAFIISVSGMLTIGDIVIRIPAAAVTAIADGVANVASNTVTVAWNPDLLGAGANVTEVTVVNRNTLCVEVRDPQVEFGYLDQSSFHSGEGTFDITNVQNNGYGGVRITVAGTYTNYLNTFIQNVTASPVSNGAGGNLIRCTVWSTAGIGGTAYIRHCLGIMEANQNWPTTIISGTQFDLVGSTFPVGKTYLGNGMNWADDDVRQKACVHQVTGVPGVNKAWPMCRSGSNTYDLLDSEFTGSWTGGGKISTIAIGFQRPNPSKGGSLDWGNMVGSDGRTFRFQDVPIGPELYFNHDASMVVGNYSITGGYTITKVFRKTKPFSSGQCDFKQTYQLPTVRFRHYLYLELDANLANGTYTIIFPPATNLPPKTFTYNDKQTRCCAIHVDQNGHRLNAAKLAYLSHWVPDRLPYGDVDYSSVTAWHLINNAGTIVATFGAPVQRVGPNTNEGLSYDSPSSNAQGPIMIQSRGPAVKVLNATKAINTLITVVDASSFNNGDLIVFTDMYHWAGAERQAATTAAYPNPGPESPAVPVGNLPVNHVGMWQLESDSGSSPLYHRVVNKLGNTFNIDCPRGVSAATVASGGSGYVVGHIIRLESLTEGIGPVLEVTSVGGGGAVTGVRVMPNEEWFWNLGYAIARIDSSLPATNPASWQAQGSGKIDYPYTIPTNPRPQISTTLHFVGGSGWVAGSGTGATFNLTWTRNPWDRTAYPARGLFPSGNPDTTVRSNPGNVFYGFPPQAFDHTTFNDLGNLCYKVNEFSNRAGTYVYGLDYSSFTTSGDYRIYIPNIGVSDPIHINEGRSWRAAKQYIKALYHQRQGCTLDGRFGFTRPDGVKPGPSRPVYKSYMPYCFSNYCLEPFGSTIPDVNAGQFVGGSYGIWLRGAETGTRLRMTGFGSHQDGGDWDVRINETCWGYYQVLEIWQRLPSTAKASFVSMGTPTCLEAGLDPTIFAGTDGLPSPLVEVIWGIEPQRQSQEPGGGVIGGINYGEGVVWNETSNNNAMSWYTWYPEPVSTFNYAFVAAKLARQLYALGGFTTLGNHYRDSAIAAYLWADSILTTTVTRDAWFTPVKDRAGWSTATYNSNMSAMIDYCQREKRTAAAALYALTGTTAYRTTFDAGGNLGAVDVRGAFGHWEYATAPFTVDAGIRDNTFNLYKNMATTNYCGNSEAPDVSYDSGMQRGIWNMAYGDNGTNWIISTPSIIFGITAYELEGNTTEANRCRKALQRLVSFRHGANQLGMCLCNGLGVRHNLESLNQDSRMLSQVLPIAGITSEGWGNLFPQVSGLMFGDSQISRIQHPQYDSDIVSVDPTVPYREQYPWAQLCWPRWELFLEIYQAIEHAEYTTQQQLLPALPTMMYLAGFDGNAATAALEPATVLLSSSINPSGPGVNVIFTCNVTGASGAPTGTVTFTSDAAIIGVVTLSGGIAQVATSALAGGDHIIVASYGGDSVYDPNSSSLIQTVGVPAEDKIVSRLAMRMRLHA